MRSAYNYRAARRNAEKTPAARTARKAAKAERVAQDVAKRTANPVRYPIDEKARWSAQRVARRTN